MVRAYVIVALALGLVIATGANPAWAQPSQSAPPDPFKGEATAGEPAGSATGSAADVPAGPTAELAEPDPDVAMPTEGATAPTPSEPPTSAGCPTASDKVCGEQSATLLMKSGGYVIVAVLLFSLLRLWWDKRGTRTAGVRFVSTMLPAAGVAGVLAYLDPMRSEALACCLRDHTYTNDILLQDSDLGRAAMLGFVPAVALFVIVAIIVKAVRS